MEINKHNSLNRFSDRVEDYLKFRPNYPTDMFVWLKENSWIGVGKTIADIGCGTGLSAEGFLLMGSSVVGIEPNREMREASYKFLANFSEFKNLEGTAEVTGLPPDSIDLIVAGQAFHWFEKEICKKEFQRILKKGGKVLLMWNDRRTDTNDFLKVYEDFLKMFGTDYEKVNHKKTQDARIFNAFFGIENYLEKDFYNFQEVDFLGLQGRVLSSSYMPNKGHPDFDFMISTLKKIFLRYQENGRVRLDYDTRIYLGEVK